MMLLVLSRAPAQAIAAPPARTDPIRDNSFLIEEAYNQEPGVVQHISTLVFGEPGGGWAYGFTQEWPLGSQTHQLSYTLVLERAADVPTTGAGDCAVNYRWMAPSTTPRVAFAPRASVILPCGDSTQGRGNGAVGWQIDLPLSLEAGRRLALHTNVGVARTRGARDELGNRANVDGYWVGQSFVWLAHPSFNPMLEILWGRSDEVAGWRRTERGSSLVVSPGARFAIDLPSGLQIVPGVAFPLETRGDGRHPGMFVYLSFEHPYRD